MPRRSIFRRLVSPSPKIATGSHLDLLRTSSPWLMLPPSFDVGREKMVYNLFSPATGKVSSFNNSGGRGETDLMQDKESKLVGSSHGWLSLFNQRLRRVFLCNPLSGHRIELPSLPGCPWKVILSHPPEEEDCRAVAILGCKERAAFCRPTRSHTWAPLSDFDWPDTSYSEIAYSAARNCIAACVNGGELQLWDIENPVRARLIRRNLFGRLMTDSTETRHSNYMIAAKDGGMILMRRYVMERLEKQIDWYCYKIDFEGGIELCSAMGDLATFVGMNHSFAVEASQFPGLEPNSICYSDARYQHKDTQDIDVFDYKKYRRHVFNYPSHHLNNHIPMPWFTPAFHRD